MDGRVAARIGTVVVGIWLEVAPAVVGYGSPAADVCRILGPVAAGAAFAAIWPVVHALRWMTVPVGALLVAAPVLGYPADAAVVSVVSGLAIAGLGLVGRAPEDDFGGGWAVIWRGRRAQRS